jgi:hypothetical protein
MRIAPAGHIGFAQQSTDYVWDFFGACCLSSIARMAKRRGEEKKPKKKIRHLFLIYLILETFFLNNTQVKCIFLRGLVVKTELCTKVEDSHKLVVTLLRIQHPYANQMCHVDVILSSTGISLA